MALLIIGAVLAIAGGVLQGFIRDRLRARAAALLVLGDLEAAAEVQGRSYELSRRWDSV